MKGKEVYLNQEGYDEYLKSINDLSLQLKQNSAIKGSSYEVAIGDGWHDNFAFEDAKRQELAIINEIETKKALLEDIKIIPPRKINKERIDINDIVKLKLYFTEDEVEESWFKLTGKFYPQEGKGYQEITYNSPLGFALYNKQVGRTIIYETPQGKKIKVEILAKEK